MNTNTAIYLIQISALVALIGTLVLCLYFAHRSRSAMNGMYRSVALMIVSLIMLFVLLIVRRIDDVLNILDSSATLILSSAVVVMAGISVISLTLDMYRIYSNRGVYEMWQQNRKKREVELEAIRKRDEARQTRRNWDDETLGRWL